MLREQRSTIGIRYPKDQRVLIPPDLKSIEKAKGKKRKE
jgi:hypothetical protein